MEVTGTYNLSCYSFILDLFSQEKVDKKDQSGSLHYSHGGG